MRRRATLLLAAGLGAGIYAGAALAGWLAEGILLLDEITAEIDAARNRWR